ncbi:Panacea domain-containing protein [Epilithonimonas vandammei]|uniref:DUF4065 domain-containing protein n=1 Tax=Epilithonimonas vandammei TaxID=2487072 RepID=A0A3G8Y394_9FLAO|nr:type II toxin-antitoxin system antitoxin SocA domain-containing protein [Epilithonimonas vandammei]AZI38537.1 DUF4065 domain-containing protein [Epilithonimonas vandammei]
METVQNISDYIIYRLKSEGNQSLSFLKLQKLLFYTQAWHLAFTGDPLFDEKFQAWIHGPVSRQIFDNYKNSKYMYSEMTLKDIISERYKSIKPEIKVHVDSVLDSYASFSSSELETMTHQEEPWLSAREGFDEYQRCEVEISEDLMRKYYGARLQA